MIDDTTNDDFGTETAESSPTAREPAGVNYALWIVQGLLALVFLFAGGTKLVLPLDVMTAQMPVALPGPFVRFVGVAEVLGALGLILPGLVHVREGLTPLAAAGLVLVMTGATGLTLLGGDVVPALVPLAVGLLAAVVAYGRLRIRPLRGSHRRRKTATERPTER